MSTEVYRLDVTQEEAVRQCFQDIGPFDHLVCTAVANAPFLEMDTATAGTVLYLILNEHTTGALAEVNGGYRLI